MQPREWKKVFRVAQSKRYQTGVPAGRAARACRDSSGRLSSSRGVWAIMMSLESLVRIRIPRPSAIRLLATLVYASPLCTPGPARSWDSSSVWSTHRRPTVVTAESREITRGVAACFDVDELFPLPTRKLRPHQPAAGRHSRKREPAVGIGADNGGQRCGTLLTVVVPVVDANDRGGGWAAVGREHAAGEPSRLGIGERAHLVVPE